MHILWHVWYTLVLRYPQRNKYIGVRSVDRGGHSVACPRPTTWPGNRACKWSRTMIRRWVGAPSWIHQALRTPPSDLRPNIRCRASNTGLLHYQFAWASTILNIQPKLYGRIFPMLKSIQRFASCESFSRCKLFWDTLYIAYNNYIYAYIYIYIKLLIKIPCRENPAGNLKIVQNSGKTQGISIWYFSKFVEHHSPELRYVMHALAVVNSMFWQFFSQHSPETISMIYSQSSCAYLIT